jgi:hypothetical protein
MNNSMVPHDNIKLLGTLKVYETNERDCISGLRRKLQRDGQFKDKEFSIVLCPNSKYDRIGLEKREQVQILAHELGHFVGHLLGLTEHKRDTTRMVKMKLAGVNPEAKPLLPMEQEAWQIAEAIVPGSSDSDAYRKSMRSYGYHDHRFADWIRRTLEIFG